MSSGSKTSRRIRGCLKWLGLAVFALSVLLIALIAVTWLQGSRAKAALRAKYPPPGQMVDLGGYRMHIYCRGSGSPTVVLDAGLGDFSPIWDLVQPEVARSVRVCSYDRAGLGWSERGPNPRTVQDIVGELHTLLAEAEIEGPYVLVGHSMGGLYVRAYATEYPDEVAGMVLVDAPHEEQRSRYPDAFTDAQQRLWNQMTGTLLVPRLLNSIGFLAMYPEEYPIETVPSLPPATRDTYIGVLLSSPAYFATVSEQYASIQDNYDQAVAMNITTLGDIPLVAISTDEVEVPDSFGLSSDEINQVQAARDQAQADLARLSSRGTLVIAADSGHYIQLDQPQLVIDAILEVLKGS
jgi:pimeloyl-ACP methyl ester carboxylesterase